MDISTLCEGCGSLLQDSYSQELLMCEVLWVHAFNPTATSTSSIADPSSVHTDHSYNFPSPCSLKRRLDQAETETCELTTALNVVKDKFELSDTVVEVLSRAGLRVPGLLYGRMAKQARLSKDMYHPALRNFACTLHFYSPKAYR